MSSMSTYRNNRSGSRLVSATQAAVSSGFLKDYGNYVGGTLSFLWVSLAVYSMYVIYKTDGTKEPNKKYYWVGPGITLLLVLIANIYYFRAKNRISKINELKSVNSTYANIALIPLYLIIVGFGLLILFN